MRKLNEIQMRQLVDELRDAAHQYDGYYNWYCPGEEMWYEDGVVCLEVSGWSSRDGVADWTERWYIHPDGTMSDSDGDGYESVRQFINERL